ncbi:hypothetical protein RchiOBHm_Chr4g0439801 [Rosa chinensis]|uniref:Uncharacterized protein n=1 Tax=Rosa chinensis TaxID=74649 RepID=A0A2P6R2W9_ROSCH|nr:hypothetical protein RchiOBHm_Chr4g0439801 [Rosa chinensis]
MKFMVVEDGSCGGDDGVDWVLWVWILGGGDGGFVKEMKREIRCNGMKELVLESERRMCLNREEKEE